MTDEVEHRIREYLNSLGRKVAKPRRIVDKEAVTVLRKRIAESDDPIEKLKLHSELERARRPRLVVPENPAAELEAHFVSSAKAWAEETGISVSAFVALKVPRDVLRRAGFAIEGSPRSTSGSSRAARLDLDEVKAAIGRLPETWVLRTLAGELNRDVATTRNYVRRLVDDQFLTVVGEDSSRQGRPSKIYSVRV